MDCSVYEGQTYLFVWDEVLHMGHYLVVAHITHFFSFDTSIGSDICYNGKGFP